MTGMHTNYLLIMHNNQAPLIYPNGQGKSIHPQCYLNYLKTCWGSGEGRYAGLQPGAVVDGDGAPEIGRKVFPRDVGQQLKKQFNSKN